MEEYLNWLKQLNPQHTNVTPQMRYQTHLMFNNTPTFTTTVNPTVDGQQSVTLTMVSQTCETFSSHAAESSNKLTYTHNIYEKMLEGFDPICILGSKWYAEKAINDTPFSVETKTHIVKTLTILNMHHHVEKLKKGTTQYYTSEQMEERVPLALTKLSLESKIKLSLNGRTDTSKITHIANIPDEWFDRLNS